MGQIPGTSIQLGFVTYLILFDTGLIIYDLKKFHSRQLNKMSKKFKLDKKLKKLKKELKKQYKKAKKTKRKLVKKVVRKLKPYKKRVAKKLTYFRNNVLGPKLKFLK